MSVSVRIETPLQGDVRQLIEGLNAHLTPLSPVEFQYKMTAEEMAEKDTLVFVARTESGEAVGIGALKTHGRLGEVKRMFTRPEMRGKRIGSALLGAITHKAQELEIEHLVLETGIGEGYQGAWRLYQNSGFTPRGAFLDYPDSGHSAFFEKRLEA